MEIQWHGSGDTEYACVDDNVVIRIDPKYYRPSEVESLHGDSTVAKMKLGWEPEYELDTILDEMIKAATV